LPYLQARRDLTKLKRSFIFKKGCSRNRYDAIASRIVITNAAVSINENRVAVPSALPSELKIVLPVEPSAFHAQSIASAWNT
jgi:hypothetical protein